MAKVPYNPVPSVAPTEQGTPEINVQTTGAAFGENVGQAVHSLGRVVEGAGDELFRRALALQDLDNRTAADEAATKNMQEQGLLYEEFRSTLGAGAKADLPAFQKRLEEVRNKNRDSLTNPAARRLYDSETRSQTARLTINGASHAATENKKWMIQTEESRLTLIKNEAFADPFNDQMFAKGLNEGFKRLENTGVIAGADEATVLAWKQKFEQEMLFERTRGLAQRDPERASKFLEANKERFGLKYDDADRIVQTNIVTKGSAAIADKENADLKEDPMGSKKSLEQRLANGRKAALEKFGDNPQALKATEQAIQSGWYVARNARKERDFNNGQTVNTGLYNPGPGGKLPTTEDELFAAGANVKDAFQQLDDKKKNSVREALLKNAKQAGVVPLTPDVMKRIYQLQGMFGDPKQIEEALAINMWDENIPHQSKMEFLKKQQQLTKNANEDPRMSRAMNVLNQLLGAPGVKLTYKDNPETYNQLRGVVWEAIKFQTEENKKPLTDEEILTIGRRLIKEIPQNAISRFFSGPEYQFQQKPNAAQTNAIRNFDKWRQMGVEPTENDIQREHVNQIYRNLYKKKSNPEVPR